MAFANIGKLKIHLGGGGAIDGAEGREAVLTILEEVERLRGEVEALKLEMNDLAVRVVAPPKASA